MMDLWNDLRKFLSVEVKLTTADPSDARSATTLSFAVSNTAPKPSPSHPNISFDDVSLTIIRGGSKKSVNLGHLSAGQTLSYDEEIEANELLDIGYFAEGSIQPAAFLKIYNAPARVQLDRGLLDPIAYLQMFAKCDVHKWRNDILDADQLAGTEWAKFIASGVDEVRDMQLRLQKIVSLIQRRQREFVGKHQQAAHEYLQLVSKELSTLLQAVNTSDERTIIRAKGRFATRLESEGIKVDEITAELEGQLAPPPKKPGKYY